MHTSGQQLSFMAIIPQVYSGTEVLMFYAWKLNALIFFYLEYYFICSLKQFLDIFSEHKHAVMAAKKCFSSLRTANFTWCVGACNQASLQDLPIVLMCDYKPPARPLKSNWLVCKERPLCIQVLTYIPAPSLLQPCTEIHRTESDTQSLHNTQTHYYPTSHVHCIYNEEYS